MYLLITLINGLNMLQFFENEQNSLDIPFLNDYLKEPKNRNADGTLHDVLEIIYASSGKGYVIKTEAFMCFLWKNSKATKQILEALNFYWEQGNGYVFVVRVEAKTKNQYSLGVDFERTSYWQKKGESFYSSLNPVEDIPLMESSNPFLPPSFPINQGGILQQADQIGSPPQKHHQTHQNGSRTSRKRSKVQSSQMNSDTP